MGEFEPGQKTFRLYGMENVSLVMRFLLMQHTFVLASHAFIISLSNSIKTREREKIDPGCFRADGLARIRVHPGQFRPYKTSSKTTIRDRFVILGSIFLSDTAHSDFWL
jgi:hypothetical protein